MRPMDLLLMKRLIGILEKIYRRLPWRDGCDIQMQS